MIDILVASDIKAIPKNSINGQLTRKCFQELTQWVYGLQIFCSENISVLMEILETLTLTQLIRRDRIKLGVKSMITSNNKQTLK